LFRVKTKTAPNNATEYELRTTSTTITTTTIIMCTSSTTLTYSTNSREVVLAVYIISGISRFSHKPASCDFMFDCSVNISRTR